MKLNTNQKYTTVPTYMTWQRSFQLFKNEIQLLSIMLPHFSLTKWVRSLQHTSKHDSASFYYIQAAGIQSTIY